MVRISKQPCVPGSGGAATELHHGFLSVMSSDLKKAGIKVTTGKDVFVVAVNNTPLSTPQDKLLQGILADGVIHAKNLPLSWLGIGMGRYGGLNTLVDVKTLAPGTRYSATLPANGSPYRAVVATRQEQVNRDYHAAAKKLDAARGTPPDTIGPIELEMNTYGHDGKVLGLVLGAYGEFSQGVYELADLIATKRAHDFCELNNMSLKQAAGWRAHRQGLNGP
mmetsp:Transcript_44298/g.56729  ORF Transcript_44298/g.56729 Transcript_44298/m.56729 type:complete len:222 (+) Transcript_44298:3441-4106(+)